MATSKRKKTPILPTAWFWKNRLSPPKMNVKNRIAPKIKPELNDKAVVPSTPRSLRAFSVQLHHGENRIARLIRRKEIIGLSMPQYRKILGLC